MDVGTVFALVERGLGIVSTLIEAGKDAKPAVEVLLGLTQAQQAGTLTEEQLIQFENHLDALVQDFNEPMD